MNFSMSKFVIKNTFSIVKVISNDTATGEKARPVYIIHVEGSVFHCFIVTTKYSDKPEHIKPYFLELLDWSFSNLKEPSWINTYDRYTLQVDKVQTIFIGTLSERDAIRLQKLLASTPSPNY